jgi:alpha-tubulin suppressor-like RCC1 family protein
MMLLTAGRARVAAGVVLAESGVLAAARIRRHHVVLVLVLVLVLALVLGVAVAASASANVVTWGEATYGRLGNGSLINPACPGNPCSTVPVAVSGVSGATAISSSRTGGLAIVGGGTVVAWGFNEEGQLGDGTDVGPESCGGYSCSTVPVAVSGLSGVTAVAAGNEQRLALLSDGTVVAWGSNEAGALGNNSTTSSSVPVPVCEVGWSSGPCPAGHYLTGVTAISAGESHSVALLSNGTVVSWGVTDGVELTHVPAPVNGLDGGVVAISSTTYGALNLALLSDGTVKSWGDEGHQGEGGSGMETTDGGLATVCEVGSMPNVYPCSAGPLKDIAAVAAGSHNGLALRSNGSVLSWGYTGYGAIGNGSFKGQYDCNYYNVYDCSPVPVAVGGLSGVTAIAAGGYDSSLALLGNGTMMAWGSNEVGQLADGTTSGPEKCFGYGCSSFPLSVPGLSGVNAISSTAALLAEPPTVVTGVASSAGASATLEGTINPNGSALLSCYVEYGLKAGPPYEHRTDCDSFSSSLTGVQDVSASVVGLAEETVYHYQLFAENGIALGEGGDEPFTTDPYRPTVVTGLASNITESSAILHATVSPNAAAVDACSFEYGINPPRYDQESEECSPLPIGLTSGQPVTAEVSGLTPNTTYHYSVAAENLFGNGPHGEYESFSTLANSHSEAGYGGAPVTSSVGPALSATASGGMGTVTVGQYGSDPEGSPPPRASNSYIDVYVSSGSTFTSLQFTDCELGGASQLEWWNPAADSGAGAYEPVSEETAPSGSPPCITVTISSTTSPDLAQMTGTVFAGVLPAGPAPTVTALSPKKGSTEGGTVVTITGTRFTDATAVKFGAVEARSFSVSLSGTTITAETAAAAAGRVAVYVTTPNGTSSVGKRNKFKFKAVKKKKQAALRAARRSVWH